MIEINDQKKKSNIVVITIVVGLIALLIVNQVTLSQVTKNQLTFKKQINDIIKVQEWTLCEQVRLNQKYDAIQYIMRAQKKYQQIKEESDDSLEKHIITSVIESVYPNITSQFTIESSNDCDRENTDRNQSKS